MYIYFAPITKHLITGLLKTIENYHKYLQGWTYIMHHQQNHRGQAKEPFGTHPDSNRKQTLKMSQIIKCLTHNRKILYYQRK